MMPSKVKDESSIAVTLPDEDEMPTSDDHEEEKEETAEELLEMYESLQLRKLFIGNLSYQTDSEALKEYFIKYGEIEECNVPVDSRTKLSKGFGFVIYRASKTLDEVMKMRPHKIDGRILEPRRAIRREEADNPAANASTEKMYVGPIRSSTHESDIRDYFSQHGNVTEVEIAKKGDHCFVTFDDFDPVDKCVNMKKHMINGCIALCKKGLTKTAMIEADQRYHQRKRRRQEREEREKRDYDLAKHGYNPQRDYWRSGHERAPHRKYPTGFGKGGDESEGDDGNTSHNKSHNTSSSSYRKHESKSHHHSSSHRSSDHKSKYDRDDYKKSSSRRSPTRRSRSPRSSRSYGSSRRDRSPRDDKYHSSSRREHKSDSHKPSYPPPMPGYPPAYPGYPPHGDPYQMGYPHPPKEYFDKMFEMYYGAPPPQYPPPQGGYPYPPPQGYARGPPPGLGAPEKDDGSGASKQGGPPPAQDQKPYYGEPGTGQSQSYTSYGY